MNKPIVEKTDEINAKLILLTHKILDFTLSPNCPPCYVNRYIPEIVALLGEDSEMRIYDAKHYTRDRDIN